MLDGLITLLWRPGRPDPGGNAASNTFGYPTCYELFCQLLHLHILQWDTYGEHLIRSKHLEGELKWVQLGSPNSLAHILNVELLGGGS